MQLKLINNFKQGKNILLTKEKISKQLLNKIIEKLRLIYKFETTKENKNN